MLSDRVGIEMSHLTRFDIDQEHLASLVDGVDGLRVRGPRRAHEVGLVPVGQLAGFALAVGLGDIQLVLPISIGEVRDPATVGAPRGEPIRSAGRVGELAWGTVLNGGRPDIAACLSNHTLTSRRDVA